MRNAVVATVESRLATPCNVRTNVNNVQLRVYIVASIPKIDETTIRFSLRLDNILDWVRSVRSEHSSEQVLWVKLKLNYKSRVSYIFMDCFPTNQLLNNLNNQLNPLNLFF